MNKRVYLFELDSVRTKDSDIIRGQRAIINEIAKNGNCVVITLNQLSDSLAIADLIRNEKTYPYIISLFKSGGIRVSLFGNKRTASQYMQEALDKCADMDGDEFIFSSLPIQAKDTCRVHLVKNALQYSDLSEISARIGLLTSAISEADKKGIPSGQILQDLKTELEDMKYILRYVKLMLTLSVTETSNIPPTNTGDTLCGFMKKISEFARKRDISHPRWQKGYNAAEKLLSALEKQMKAEGLSQKHLNNRSNWLKRILPNDENGKPEKDETKLTDEQFIAALIVNLAYNYTLEDSIAGISRHYDEKHIAATFKAELVSRIEAILSQYDTVYNKKAPTPREWAGVARIGEYKNFRRQRRVSKKYKRKTAERSDRIYESSFLRERIRWELAMLGRLTRYSAVAIFYILLFSAIEYVFSIFEGMASTWFIGLQISELVTKVIVIVLFGFFGSVISGATKIPDIFQCVKNIALYIRDMTVVLGGRYESYKRNK